MMNEAVGRGISRSQRLIERFERERGLQMVGEGKAHDFSRERVDDDGEIDEVLGQPDVGDVGDPELIEAGRTAAAREVRPDGEAVPAVAGARNKGPAPEAEQIVRPHQSEHALGVDDQALPPQFLGDAPIAVMAFGEGFALDQIAQVRILARRRMRAEMAVIAGARNAAQPAQALDVGVVLGEALLLERDHLFDDRVEVGAPPLGLAASQSRKASRKKCRSAC